MKTWYFNLVGPVPSKKNSKRIVSLKGGRKALISSKGYLGWEKRATIDLMGQGKPAMPLDSTDMVTVTFGMSSKRRRDLSNMVEGVMDALVSVGILSDDNWIVVPELRIIGQKSDHDFVLVEIQTEQEEVKCRK